MSVPDWVSRFPARSWRTLGPFLMAMFWLAAGYFHYAPGTVYSLSAGHYRDWAFPAFRYSDIIWLYLRDNLKSRPIPYLDYSLEYPPLTGFLSWVLSWLPGLPGYFAGAYVLLAGCALLAVWALQRLPGANPWLFAASPALFFYTGHQWDLAAIAVTALALLALTSGRKREGVIGLALGTSLKLFPLVFFVALTVETLRDRKWAHAVRDTMLFALVTAIVNVPVAVANADGWSFFFRWNRDRLADSGVWILWRDAATADLTRWSLVAAFTAGVALTALALRQRGPLTIPLGAAYLIWWLLLNKTFTTHLMLWAILALALVSAPVWLWVLVTAIDAVGFQVGNYLNLYNVASYQHAPLIRTAVEQIYDPLQIARTWVLGICAVWMVAAFGDQDRRAAHSMPKRLRSPAQPGPQFHPLGAGSLGSRERRIGVAAALCFFTFATVYMTWPYAVNASSATAVGFDPFLQIWLSEWVQHAFVTNPGQLYSANIFYPFSLTLAYTDANIPGALAAFPIRILTGDPILTNSILVLASFVLAACGTFLLVRYVTGNQAVGVVAGLAYAFLPYRMVHLWHLNWLEGALFPWFVFALLRLLDRPGIGRAVAVGSLAAIITLVSFYFSLQLALVALLVSASVWISRRTWPTFQFWRASALAAGVALAVAIPFLLPYLQVNEQQRLERTLVDAEQYKALPASYLQLAPWDPPNALQSALGVRAAPNLSLTEVGQATHADGHQHPEIVTEDALYPGLVVLIFAVAAVVLRRPRWLVASLLGIAIAAGVLSLGPTWGPHHAGNLSLPYAWLFDHVPFFRAMRVPARLGGLVDLALVLLAALGLHASWNAIRQHIQVEKRQATGAVLTVLVSLLVLVDLSTGPVPLEQVDRSQAALSGAEWLATQPPGPVMEFPAESVFADPAAASVRRHTGETLFRSTIHWQPVVNGNSGFIPQAYSDFIERFVSELARQDGTVTGPVSHLDTESVLLLQQIGVRYVVFNVDHYAPGDWSAVETELALLVEQGHLINAGRFGRQQIFILTPSVPAPTLSRISLFAPTLLRTGDPWSTWIGIEAPSTPSALSLTMPAQLTLDWYDDQGRLLRGSRQVLPLPTVLDDAVLLCSAVDCLTSRPFTDLRLLPQPERMGAWVPTEPGHYIVQAYLSGDRTLSCQIDLDVVETEESVIEQGGNDPHRWAACVEEFPYPVNNPGLPPFTLDSADVTLSDSTLGVEFSVKARHDEQLRAWFILSPRGLREPWRDAVYQSPSEEEVTRAGEQVHFHWSVSLPGSVSPGAYDLTVWVHHRAEGKWQHAAGGSAMDGAVIVNPDGSLRRGGTLRVKPRDSVSHFQTGDSIAVPIQIAGEPDSRGCLLRWSLASAEGGDVREGVTECSARDLALPSGTPVGTYRLTVEIHEGDNLGEPLSDGFATTITVTDTPDDRAE